MSKTYLTDRLRHPWTGFKSRSRKLVRGQHGFTLVELLVVVAILGVLAGIITPTVAHFAGKGKTEAAKTELQEVKTSIGAAIADNNLSQSEVWTPHNASHAPVWDFSNIHIDTAGSIALYPTYLSSEKSQTTSLGIAGYCWNDLGIVTQETSTSTCP